VKIEGIASARSRTRDKLVLSKSSSRKCAEQTTAEFEGSKFFRRIAIIHRCRCSAFTGNLSIYHKSSSEDEIPERDVTYHLISLLIYH